MIQGMKIIVALVFMAGGFYSGAQSHNTNCDCCKFSKNYEKNCKNVPNESKPCGCPACGDQKKKEDAARKAEDKKIHDAEVARLKAEQEAKKKAELAEQQRKMAEEKAEAEKKAQVEKQREADRARYASMLEKYKIDVSKGPAKNPSNYDPSLNIVYDSKDKSYQIKYIDSTITTIRQNTSSVTTVYRADSTNYFIKSEYVKTKYNSQSNFLKDPRKISIVNMWGEQVPIDGITTFQFYTISNGKIILYQLSSGFSRMGDRCIGGAQSSGEQLFVSSMDGVNAFYQKHKNRKWSGLGFGYYVCYAAGTRYVLNRNLEIIEKQTGILIQNGEYDEASY